MKNIILSSIKKVSLVVTMLLMHWMASAVTYTWVGGLTTDWSLSTNWSPALSLGLLTSADELVIPDASTTLNDPTTSTASTITIGKLTIESNGVATLPSGLIINVTNSSGNLIDIATGAVFNNNSTITLNGANVATGVFNNGSFYHTNGTLNINNTVTAIQNNNYFANGGSSSININNSFTGINQSGSSFFVNYQIL